MTQQNRTTSIKAFRHREEGDRNVEFARLFEENYAMVSNYVRYRMAGSQAAEDVTSEAFLKAARAFDRFDPSRSKFSTWVICIARNCVADYWKKNKPTSNIDDVAESAFAVDDDYPGLNEDAVIVRKLLAALPDDERELVFMKYYEGMRNVDIAHELGMNGSTVSTKLQRALAKMRKVAERNG